MFEVSGYRVNFCITETQLPSDFANVVASVSQVYTFSKFHAFRPWCMAARRTPDEEADLPPLNPRPRLAIFTDQRRTACLRNSGVIKMYYAQQADGVI